MNLEEQQQPGEGADGKLAKVTIEDLFCELKTRCTAIALIMVCDDEDGDECLVVKTMGSRLAMLGAAEVVRQHYLELDIKRSMGT